MEISVSNINFRFQQLNAALDETRVWLNGVTDLLSWLDELETRIPDDQLSTSNIDKLKQLLDDVKVGVCSCARSLQ